MNEIRLSGLLRDRYRTKFFGLVNRFSYPVLGKIVKKVSATEIFGN